MHLSHGYLFNGQFPCKPGKPDGPLILCLQSSLCEQHHGTPNTLCIRVPRALASILTGQMEFRLISN